VNGHIIAIRDKVSLPIGLGGYSLRVRVVADNLGWILSEVGDLRLERLLLLWFLDFVQIDTVLVGEGVKDIHIVNSILATLFVAVDQIYPLSNLLRDVFAL
jgi:hypothetical protein